MARTTKQDTVRELQRTLYRAAKADPGRRFHALHDKVHRRDVLERAWELVRANHGAAGIDKQTIADVEEYGVSKLLDQLAADLTEGRWRPLPARRVFIPKPGRNELRPLSIPAVRDRIVQTAAKLVIEPIFEADMLECSFGFRPRRSQHDALQVLVDEAWRGKRWIVESDVANCFEAIPHSQLMLAIEERIVDRHVLKLLRAMLRAGVMQDGAVKRDLAGTPQGGVISPCLCNVYLHRLDRQWAERGTGELVRFADDMVVMCRTRGEAERALVALRQRSPPSSGSRSRTPRRGSWSCARVGRGWTFSASITAGCAGPRPLRSISASSPAGPHVKRCSVPACGSTNSRTAAGCGYQLKRLCRTSTASCAAGRGTSDMGTPLLPSKRSRSTRSCAWRSFIAKRHKRSARYGWWAIHQSPDRMGLIDLGGTIVAPRPNRPWRTGR